MFWRVCILLYPSGSLLFRRWHIKQLQNASFIHSYEVIDQKVIATIYKQCQVSNNCSAKVFYNLTQFIKGSQPMNLCYCSSLSTISGANCSLLLFEEQCSIILLRKSATIFPMNFPRKEYCGRNRLPNPLRHTPPN